MIDDASMPSYPACHANLQGVQASRYDTVISTMPPEAVLMINALQGVSAREGLPKIRAEWVAKRDARGDKVQTQQFYAKQGVITEEMAFCAARERIEPEFIRSEAGPSQRTSNSRAHRQPDPTSRPVQSGWLWYDCHDAKNVRCRWLVAARSSLPTSATQSWSPLLLVGPLGFFLHLQDSHSECWQPVRLFRP